MSAQITHSPLLGLRTYLSDPNLNFIDIASLLDRETELKEFAQIVENRDFSDVCSHVANTMGHLMPFKAIVNVLANENGGTVFRDDYEYYIAHYRDAAAYYPFDPFSNIPVQVTSGENIYCREVLKFCLPAEVYLAHCETLNMVTMANPLVAAIIADYLTFALNVEQRWVTHHTTPKEHPMQQYFSLASLISQHLPHLGINYELIRADIEDTKTAFMNDVIRSHKSCKPEMMSLDLYAQSINGIPDSYLEQVWEARGKQYESVAFQDLWDHPEVQDFLETSEVELSRTIGRLSRIEQVVAELATSQKATRSYDVYQCHAIGSRVVIKNLGDYRVLNWELSNG